MKLEERIAKITSDLVNGRLWTSAANRKIEALLRQEREDAIKSYKKINDKLEREIRIDEWE